MPHFDGKARMDGFIRSEGSLFRKTTFLWVMFYAKNLFLPMFRPCLEVSGNACNYLSRNRVRKIESESN